MVAVEDSIVIPGGVPTVVVVNVAVAVVVDAVVGDFCFVDPMVGCEVWVVEVGPFDDGNHNVIVLCGLSAGGDVPCFSGAYVSAGRTACLTGIAVVPLRVEFRVIWNGFAHRNRVVVLHGFHPIGEEDVAKQFVFIEFSVVKTNEVNASAL